MVDWLNSLFITISTVPIPSSSVQKRFSSSIPFPPLSYCYKKALMCIALLFRKQVFDFAKGIMEKVFKTDTVKDVGVGG